MILDNLLRYNKSQSGALDFSVTHKWLKDGIPNRRGDARPVIPNADFQAGPIPGGGYDDLPRVQRNCLASIQYEVGDRPFDTVGMNQPADKPL